MKVLHIAQAHGGVEKYIHMLLSNMDRERYENVLICSRQYNKGVFEELTSAVEAIDMKRDIGIGDVKNIVRIRSLIKKYSPDIVYCHSSKAGALGRIASLGLNVKTVYNAHGWAFNMRGASRSMRHMYAFVEWILGLFTDKIVCISESELRDAVRHHVGNKGNRVLICNGVDINRIEQSIRESALTRDNLNIPSDAFVVGMNGRISQQKAPDIFAQMAVRVKQSVPGAHFVIVGDGECREEVEKFVEKNGLRDCFHIVGWVDDAFPYLSLFNVGVLLSRWEGFGLALCEYMVAGLPIVATRVDAIPELVHEGENGFLVDVDDPESASEAVVKLSADKSLRDEMICNGHRIVNEKYSINRTVKQHEDLFDVLVK